MISVYLPSADRKVNSIHKEVCNKYYLTEKENIILIQVRIVLHNFFLSEVGKYNQSICINISKAYADCQGIYNLIGKNLVN